MYFASIYSLNTPWAGGVAQEVAGGLPWKYKPLSSNPFMILNHVLELSEPDLSYELTISNFSLTHTQKVLSKCFNN
jgi:hypothetical protein